MINQIRTDLMFLFAVWALGLFMTLMAIGRYDLPPITEVGALRLEMAQHEVVGVDFMSDNNREAYE